MWRESMETPHTFFSNAIMLTFLLLNLALGRVVGADTYNRDDFPADFVFGSGTSAYQVEGAANEEGRSDSIWDTFAHAGYGHGGNGDVACDGYHKYKVNTLGLRIQPHVSLHNYDLPQVLEDEYGGWVSRDIIRDFTYYADVCFREFGDRVLYWTTVNEPNIFAMGGYDQGTCPPLRCSPPFCAIKNNRGNSTYEPYLAVHHILLAHSSAARLVMEPLQYGDYPISMKKNAGIRIPAFTTRESEQLKGSFDFIGLIHYTNINITDNSDVLKNQLRDYAADMAAKIVGTHLFSNEEYPITPWVMREELNKFKLLYGNPPIFIHENGQRTASNSSLQDVSRVKYLHEYIGGVLDALRDGVNIKGYFSWSFLDLYELLDGYEASFGLYYVDRDDPELKRHPKLSAKWYSRFLKNRSTSIVGTVQLETDPSLEELQQVGEKYVCDWILDMDNVRRDEVLQDLGIE
ncbi:Hydroxyisourate hydrolase [Vigna angularis]|uniref:Hydroxyisourate hydrolase n=1 Tax=Phaseolus angularis TaxID=3914 RepID=A0A8T0KUW9_PHAAN|nr:Hydroxyisourate hydrolase [Vigna angularis]